MSSWHSYPSIFNMGHRAIKDLLTVEVNVEEKIDGSQFSFGLIEDEPSGFSIRIRSKGAVMLVDAPEKMFNAAAETVKNLANLLHPGWTYRGEYLAKPKHNALAYDRVPKGNIIIFDISTGEESYLSYEDKVKEAERLGLEVVPLLYSGKIDTIETFRKFLGTVSILSGQKVEGVVVKPRDYNLFGQDKKTLMGKFVSEGFKEVHNRSWKENNLTGKDILTLLGDKYCNPARWNKAEQHLREAGKIVDDVKDIGPIIKEIPEDVLKECKDDIKEDLFKWAWPHIKRGIVRGFPEFYKDKLLRRSFEESQNETVSSEGLPLNSSL